MDTARTLEEKRERVLEQMRAIRSNASRVGDRAISEGNA